MAKEKNSWFDDHIIVLCDNDNMKSAIENKIKKDILKEKEEVEQALACFSIGRPTEKEVSV